MNFLIVSPFPLLAYETSKSVFEVIEEYPHILKCDAACHKVKNITLAKKIGRHVQNASNATLELARTPFLHFPHLREFFYQEILLS